MTKKEFLNLVQKLMNNPESLQNLQINTINNSNSSKNNNEIIITDYDKEIIEMKGIQKRKDGRYIIRLQKIKYK